MAVLLTRSGAEHLAALATLLEAREVVLSAGALARVAYEHGVRAFLCLDPRADIRDLAARAMINDLASASQAAHAMDGFDGEEAEKWKANMRTRLERYQELAERCFANVSVRDKNRRRWHVDGERHLTFAQAATTWSECRLAIASDDASAHAGGYYRVLSLFSHPQAFASHPGLVDPARLSTNIGVISRASGAAAASMLDAIGILTAYYGWGSADAVWGYVAKRAEELQGRYANALHLKAFGR